MLDGAEKLLQGKRMLITGGGGYFGQKLGNELKRQGAEVVLFDIAWPFDDTEAYSYIKCVQVVPNTWLVLVWLKIGLIEVVSFTYHAVNPGLGYWVKKTKKVTE